jgi:isochorismate hydrolase
MPPYAAGGQLGRPYATLPLMRLDRNRAVLVVIDVQERLMPVIHDRFAVEQNLERLIRGVHILGVPTLVTEQYVKGLGATVEPLRRALEEASGYRPMEKQCFSAHGCDAFSTQLSALERDQILLTGVEAHVCVYQTALDLMNAGLEVTIVADAISSRTAQNKEIALRRLLGEGAKLASTEMVLFELLAVSGTAEFRAVSRLIK